jgi:hypothetical protein
MSTDTPKPMVEIRIRGFFISDSEDMNLAPAVVVLMSEPAKCAAAVQAIAEKFVKDGAVAARVIKEIVGASPLSDIKDWRFMTQTEIEEYRAEE